MPMERIIGSEEIRGYWPSLCYLGRRYVGRYGAELDDIVQEGAIFVWQSLQKGTPPSETLIQARMRNWVRTMEYQTRYTRLQSYEHLLEKQLIVEGKLESPHWREVYTDGLDEPSEDY